MDDALKDIQKLTRNYPTFADGRIDYTNERTCPVINCTVVCGNEALLTFRSANLIAYPSTWNGISGFIDEIKPIEQIVLDELNEEVGIKKQNITHLHVFDKIIQIDNGINREWHVFPALAVVETKPKIVTNWENKIAKWVPITEVYSYDLLPGYAPVFDILHNYLKTERGYK